MTESTASQAAEPTVVQRLHRTTTRWPLPGRIAWWILLLPVALALFSGGRLSGWPRRIGLSTAALLAAFVAVGAFAEPPPTQAAPAQFASAAQGRAESDVDVEDAAEQAQAATDKATAEKMAADTAAADKAAADKAAADKAIADKAAADKALADKAAADKVAADKAAAQKAAADKAAADKAAADRVAAEKAAADKAAAAAAAQQAAAAPAPAGAKEYANCTELRKDYRGGVARPGAVNEGGATNYAPHYDNALYEANAKSDRDKDGIACEA